MFVIGLGKKKEMICFTLFLVSGRCLDIGKVTTYFDTLTKYAKKTRNSTGYCSLRLPFSRILSDHCTYVMAGKGDYQVDVTFTNIYSLLIETWGG